MPHFQLSLNLPHAGRIAARIDYHVRNRVDLIEPRHERLFQHLDALLRLLVPIHSEGENPAPEQARAIVEQAAALGRALTDEIERHAIGHDRLGQCMRNLFECLELGEEGARLSLRAGENPNSLLRPV